jgi:hypothetical protein
MINLTDQIEQWDRPLLNVVSQKIMSKHLKQLEKLCTIYKKTK